MVDVKDPGSSASVALGCMNFGKRTPAPDAERILARAVERGVTFFDTANVYADGESEKILGRALRGRRERFEVATKVGSARAGGKPEGLSRAVVLRAVDASLARLGMDYVDVYYLHAPDHTVPIEETLAVLEELRSAGKIRAYGVSNYAAWQILEMMKMDGVGPRAELGAVERSPGGRPGPVISQVMYNLLIRQTEVEYAAFTRRYPIHTTVYNPLAGGLLTGRIDRAGDPAKGSRFDKNRMYQGRYWSDRFFDLVEEYRAVARDEGMSLVDLSYAWLAGRDHVDSILVGPASLEHLDAALDGCGKVVSPAARERIDGIHRAYLGTDASYVR